ncbi:nuclear transport factor 2 family protein [Nocardioides sp.]|uniref:nuclear transport factor 2 family protein n=1 Tax=Nocardioides sp. TaxID=35761 RepID=UPI003514AC5B
MTRDAVPVVADPRLQHLLDKHEIHELVLLYCRGVDRQDPELLRSLYTPDATDHHGPVYQGDAEGYVRFLEDSFPVITIGAHYVTNHLVELDLDDPDRAQGEVYALGYHHLPAHDGHHVDSLVGVRYLDHYRRHRGAWRFASRDVVFDLDRSWTLPDSPGAAVHAPHPTDDASYRVLTADLFRRRTS